MNDKQYLCIYHGGGCIDGFGAAWVVRQGLKNYDAEFFAATYGSEPPNVTGKHVFIVDFSYDRDTLIEMGGKAESILVLDHHKTSAEALASFPKFDAGIIYDVTVGDWSRIGWKSALERCEAEGLPPIAACFDMERSGVMLAWDHFFPGCRPPEPLRRIQDRDLWKFELEHTREVTAALFSHRLDFELWDILMASKIDDLQLAGSAIMRAHDKNIKFLIDHGRIDMVIGGYNVKAVNCPRMFASDIGQILNHSGPFGATHWDTAEGREFSLRSSDGNVDVSEVAAGYNGGGHRNAADFKVPHGHPLASLK